MGIEKRDRAPIEIVRVVFVHDVGRLLNLRSLRARNQLLEPVQNQASRGRAGGSARTSFFTDSGSFIARSMAMYAPYE